MSPIGSVLARFSRITLATADEKQYSIEATPAVKLGLRMVGIPHLGFRARARIVFDFFGNPRRSARILDAGAGYGIYALTLASCGYNVDALELAPERVEALRALLAENVSLAAQVHPIEGSLTALSFPNDSYDRIVCSDVIEHIADDAAAVHELVRVLAPGGTLVLTVPYDSAHNRILYRRFGHERPGYTEDSMRILLKKLGGVRIEAVRAYEHALGSFLFELHNRLRSPALMAATFYILYPFYLLDMLLPIGEPGGIGFKIVKEV